MTPAPEKCAECDRLWEDYARAVSARMKIIARRHRAAIQGDSTVLDQVAAVETDLAQKEIRARRAIYDHEAEHESV